MTHLQRYGMNLDENFVIARRDYIRAGQRYAIETLSLFTDRLLLRVLREDTTISQRRTGCTRYSLVVVGKADIIR